MHEPAMVFLVEENSSVSDYIICDIGNYYDDNWCEHEIFYRRCFFSSAGTQCRKHIFCYSIHASGRNRPCPLPLAVVNETKILTSLFLRYNIVYTKDKYDTNNFSGWQQ